ncbi:MAG: DUF1015 family protein [Rhodospirillales bacterium]|nr:DUF1015 family protein [Rhodospirillales bacterium]
MTLIRPFAGLRPSAARAADVASPPYDVLSVADARAHAAGKPWSFLHVTRAEIDLAPGADGAETYEGARRALRKMVDEGVLRRDAGPRYYVYRVACEGHQQTGIVSAASIAAYESGRIRRHEATMPEKEEDRARHMDAVDAQTGLVFAVHRADSQVDGITERICDGRPANDVTDADGVRHALWVIDDRTDISRLTEAFEGMVAIYIADGHHRSAAAARVADRRRTPGGGEDEAWGSFLIASFPDDQVRVLAYNRLIRSLGGLSPEAFVAAVRERFEVTPADGRAEPRGPGEFAMYLERGWHRLALRRDAPRPQDTIAALDVSVLGEHLLQPILGIVDVRRDPRIDFAGGADGLANIERAVDGGAAAVAFALYPTSLRDLMAIADRGLMMPPKSTWFDPKLADGLVTYPFF